MLHPTPTDHPGDHRSREVDDAVLLAQLRAGDIDAFATLYRRHEPAARRYARRLAPGFTDDVVAEAFTASLAAIERGHGPVDQFRPYLFTAVRRQAGRAYQRLSASGADGSADQPEEVDFLGGVESDHPEVETAFAALPARWRQVLFLIEVEGRPIHEVADDLGLSANATSALLYRAKRGLRQAYLEITDQHDG